MKFKVIKTFVDGDTTRKVGDIITADGNRLAKLMKYKLIGLIDNNEKAVQEIETEEIPVKIPQPDYVDEIPEVVEKKEQKEKKEKKKAPAKK